LVFFIQLFPMYPGREPGMLLISLPGRLPEKHLMFEKSFDSGKVKIDCTRFVLSLQITFGQQEKI